MSLTRASVESILLRRCGTTMQRGGFDYQTKNGENEDLNDPIGSALRALGYGTTDPALVVDGDVSGVSAADYNALLDLGELRILETVQSAVSDQVSTSIGPQRRELQQFAAILGDKIARLQSKVKDLYGVGAPSISASVVELDFMEKSDNA